MNRRSASSRKLPFLNLFLTLIVAMSTTNALASSTQCHQYYLDSISTLTPTLSRIGKILVFPVKDQIQLMESYSDVSLEAVRGELKIREEVAAQIATEKPEEIAALKNITEQLSQSGFLMSPFHEYLYLHTLYLSEGGINTKDRHSFLNPHGEQTKETLRARAFARNSESEEDVKDRRDFSDKMLAELTQDPIDIHNWNSFKLIEKQRRATSVIENLNFKNRLNLKIKQTDLIKYFNSLSSIIKSYDRSLLRKVFEYSIPDIQTVASARARGFFDKAFHGWFLPLTSLGLTGLGMETGTIPHGPDVLLLFSLPILSVMSTALLPEQAATLSRLPGRARAFLSRNIIARKANERIISRAEKANLAEISQNKTNEVVNSSLAKDIELDVDFTSIKIELRSKKLSSDIEISKWGSLFEKGLENLNDRLQLVTDRMALFSKKSNALENEVIRYDDISSVKTLEQKQTLRTQISSQQEFSLDILAPFLGIKSDLLSLSVALDRYQEVANRLPDQRQLTEYEKRILKSKMDNFSSYVTQIEAMAILVSSAEQAIFEEVTSLDQLKSRINTEGISQSFAKLRK
jgi:hypothetical protein